MKTRNDLEQFVQLREGLRIEKTELERRLMQINAALASDGNQSSGAVATVKTTRKAGNRKRPRNRMSLPEAVIRVTTAKPLTKDEILIELKKLGYRFSAKKPINSLNVVLYGKKPKFKNERGKFSPAEARMKGPPVSGRPKQKLRVAGRTRITPEVRARSVEVKDKGKMVAT